MPGKNLDPSRYGNCILFRSNEKTPGLVVAYRSVFEPLQPTGIDKKKIDLERRKKNWIKVHSKCRIRNLAPG